MTKPPRLAVQIFAVTLLALIVEFFFAIYPMLVAIFMMTRPGITDAELIRQIWHFRLVQPEWISGPGQLFKWMEAEACQRSAVVFLGWLATVMTLIRRRRRGAPKSSNQPLQPTAGPCDAPV